jgi:flagellar biosynthesis protein FlhG
VSLKLDRAVDRLLQVAVESVNDIPQDGYVPLAVMRQKAVVELFLNVRASQAFTRLARQVAEWPLPEIHKSSVQLLWRGLVHAG